MLEITTIPTALFDANCYVVAPDGPGPVLIVDPGATAAAAVRRYLAQTGRTVGAVLLTHGHADHVWEAAAVSDLAGETPALVYIPGPDREWLDDPLGRLGMRVAPPSLVWQPPSDVRDVPVGTWQPIPGVRLRTVPSPGHSAGSTVFLLGGPAQVDGTLVADAPGFSGDVVFAGSVGRTDLPGGDELEMRESLRTLAATVDPATTLLPGHGPATTWQQELDSNPFVQRALTRTAR